MPRNLLLTLIVLTGLAAQSASALVSTPGADDSSEQALQGFVSRVWGSEPFPYWAHVGRIGRSTGVYLGNGQILTAAHVGAGEFELPDGSRYQPVRASAITFSNRDGSTVDLCLFRVKVSSGDSIASLKPIPLTTTSPKIGNRILLLGSGLGGDEAKGSGSFTWNDEYRLRWGVNEIEEIYTAPMPTHDFQSFGFAAKFDREDHQCQATPGDSGGAAFHFNEKSGRWELAGIIVAVDSEYGRAEFGNQTYIADPALFRRELSIASRPKTPSIVGRFR